ncbi:hypothetical protein OKW21_004132 [Catalinimonas alkaloidigena]|nr:hypothetical protein [Catalinimonas alkaloidigena]
MTRVKKGCFSHPLLCPISAFSKSAYTLFKANFCFYPLVNNSVYKSKYYKLVIKQAFRTFQIYSMYLARVNK